LGVAKLSTDDNL